MEKFCLGHSWELKGYFSDIFSIPLFHLLTSCLLYSDNEDPAEFYFGNSTIFYDWKECSTILDQSIINESITVPENLFKLSNNDLRMELQKYGEIPGPIMTSTRNVYIKRLARLQSGSMDSKVKTNTAKQGILTWNCQGVGTIISSIGVEVKSQWLIMRAINNKTELKVTVLC